MTISPHSPRRQRKALYTADSFERRIRMGVPLSRELRSRFRRRTVPVRKGDTVRVLSGSFVGREERVAKVDRRGYRVTLDNVTLKTADEKLKPLSLGVGNLVITRLNLSDPWRRRSLKVREEDVTPEERGEATEGEETPEPGTPALPLAETPAETKEPLSEEPAEEEPEAAAPAAPKKPGAKPVKEEEGA
jgi:large subunit ribosomal protein L24